MTERWCTCMWALTCYIAWSLLTGHPHGSAMHIAPHVKDEYPNVCIYMYTRILERAPLSLWRVYVILIGCLYLLIPLDSSIDQWCLFLVLVYDEEMAKSVHSERGLTVSWLQSITFVACLQIQCICIVRYTCSYFPVRIKHAQAEARVEELDPALVKQCGA